MFCFSTELVKVQNVKILFIHNSICVSLITNNLSPSSKHLERQNRKKNNYTNMMHSFSEDKFQTF